MQMKKQRPSSKPKESNYARKRRERHETQSVRQTTEPTPGDGTIRQTGIVTRSHDTENYVFIETEAGETIYVARKLLSGPAPLKSRITCDVDTAVSNSHSMHKRRAALRVVDVEFR